VPYNENIPQPTDRISASQAALLANFAAINTLVGVNHYTFNLANAGKHQFVSLPEQAVAPATAVDEGAVYTKAGAYTPIVSQLFFRRENSGTQIDMTSALLTANNGWSQLPSGLLIKWGETGTGAGTYNLPFPAAGAGVPRFAAGSPFQVMITTYAVEAPNVDSDVFVRLESFDRDSITTWSSRRTEVTARAAWYRYLAIGIGA